MTITNQEMLEKLTEIVEACATVEREASSLEEDMRIRVSALNQATVEVSRAWSGSWLGYQASLYYRDFERPPEPYDIQWGGARAGWEERTYEQVADRVERAANVQLQEIAELANHYQQIIDRLRGRLVLAFAAARDRAEFADECDRVDALSRQSFGQSREEIIRARMPGALTSSDATAVNQGVAVPPHVHLEADIASVYSVLDGGKSILRGCRLLSETTVERLRHMSDSGRMRQVTGRSVFLVHGRDSEAKNEAARFIERLGVPLIVLNEQPNEGSPTVIEKLEDYAGQAGFAVVLLTGDDIGKLVNDNETQRRARQNVLFEAGFFMGLLGRKRVCLVLVGDIEIPSDMAGLMYVRMIDEWKLNLLRELQAAGFEVQL